MRLHRFIGDFDLTGDEIHVSEKKILHQMKSVLRLKKGDSCILSDGKGNETKAMLLSLSATAGKLKAVKTAEKKISQLRNVTLYQGILKKENFEWAAQKATELGVYKIVPLLTER